MGYQEWKRAAFPAPIKVPQSACKLHFRSLPTLVFRGSRESVSEFPTGLGNHPLQIAHEPSLSPVLT